MSFCKVLHWDLYNSSRVRYTTRGLKRFFVFILSFGWDSLNLVRYLQTDAVKTKGGEVGICEGDSKCVCM